MPNWVNVGVIAVDNDGLIENCKSLTGNGSYMVYNKSSTTTLGGIVAVNYNNGVIISCTSTGNIYSICPYGTIAGYNYGTIIP